MRCWSPLPRRWGPRFAAATALGASQAASFSPRPSALQPGPFLSCGPWHRPGRPSPAPSHTLAAAAPAPMALCNGDSKVSLWRGGSLPQRFRTKAWLRGQRATARGPSPPPPPKPSAQPCCPGSGASGSHGSGACGMYSRERQVLC